MATKTVSYNNPVCDLVRVYYLGMGCCHDNNVIYLPGFALNIMVSVYATCSLYILSLHVLCYISVVEFINNPLMCLCEL